MSQTETFDLTDIENACIEAAQENGLIVYADTVVRYVNGIVDNGDTATIDRYVTKAQVNRALRKLHDSGVMTRLPRSSRGWGQGWDPPAYQLIQLRQRNEP